MKCNKQLKYSNHVAFSHFHSTAVNNSGLSKLILYLLDFLYSAGDIPTHSLNTLAKYFASV